MDSNGTVGRGDVTKLLDAFGGAQIDNEDLNGDGLVGLADLALLQLHLDGSTVGSPHTAAVPEPSALILIAFGMVVALTSRRYWRGHECAPAKS